jgi:hypothetical protein
MCSAKTVENVSGDTSLDNTKKLKIYLISTDDNNAGAWDVVNNCAVVIAETEEEAAKMHPNGGKIEPKNKKKDEERDWSEWAHLNSWTRNYKKVEVEYLGDAKAGSEKGVVCAEYYSGE